MADAPDPFILYHTRKTGVLELNGRASPGSIRDQFIRGVLAVDGLLSADLLRSGESLLIVGAGVAGVSAALRASIRNVSVSLVDQAAAPLSLISTNKSRVVSPTIFDWPSSHWEDDRFDGAFPYLEGSPEKVCNNLLAAVGRELARDPSPLHIYPNVKWLQMEPGSELGPPWRCAFEVARSDDISAKQIQEADRSIRTELSQQTFHAVLLCSGIGGSGEEGLLWKDRTGPFPFFHFWQNDPWPQRSQPQRYVSPLPRQAHGESAQVVIIGAGDGGIQDLIRFLTNGKSVREVLSDLRKSLGSADPDQSLGSADPEWMATLYRTLDNEDAFRRKDIYWKTTQPLLEEWHTASRKEVARFYHGDSDRQQRIRYALKNLIVFTDILIFQREPSLGRCYAVNRFLALLLERYLEQEGQHGSPFRYGREAASIECLSRKCLDHKGDPGLKPNDHLDGEHRLIFKGADGVPQTVHCRTVVLRIGARLPSTLRKEMLPYWLPDWGPPSRLAKKPENLPPFLLRTDQAWSAAVWNSLIATAVLKDATGRVFAYNPRFAWLVEEKKPGEIIGHLPSEYWKKETGVAIEECDHDVRTDKRFLATCEILDRNHEPTNHITFRFPLRLGDKSFGSASLGIQDLHGRIITMPATGQILPLPSVAELDRFFADMPLPVSVTDRNHCFVYANEAFCRCLREFAQSITEARRSIYGSTLDEFLKGWSKGEEDAGNECKNTIWKARTTKTWTSHPRFGGYDLAVGFPVFDEYEQMIGLGAIRLPLEVMGKLQPTTSVAVDCIDLQELIPPMR